MAILISKALLLQNPSPAFSSTHLKQSYYTNRTTVSLLPFPQKPKPYSLRRTPKHTVFASSTSSPTSPNNPSTNSHNPTQSVLNESIRSISTILALTVAVSSKLINLIRNLSLKVRGICLTPTPDELATIQTLQESVVCTVGPLFFAALRDRPSGYLNTPLTVVAAGLSKWLDIYSGVLMVRVLLSWFPNIPWDRQPLSAIRDLCDPYLNLFRNIIPPIFDTLDVSPLLAFAVLGTLGSILNNSRGMY